MIPFYSDSLHLNLKTDSWEDLIAFSTSFFVVKLLAEGNKTAFMMNTVLTQKSAV